MAIKPKKIEKNIYSIKGEKYDLNIFFKETILAESSKKSLKVLWETDGVNAANYDIIINPFSFLISNEKLDFIRRFSFKDKINVEKSSAYNYGLYHIKVEIKYKQLFPKILYTKRKIEILSVKYGDIEVECVNNIPQYWKYPEHFALIQSLGKCHFTNDKEMEEHWKDYGDGLYSGYFIDREYALLGYEAYQKINGYIFKKWSRNYQSTVDIFPENVEDFHPKNIKYTITSLIGNVTDLEKEDYRRETFIKDYPFGCFVEGSYKKEDYDNSGIKELIHHEFSVFSTEKRLCEDFRFVKIYFKKSDYIPENLSNPLEKKYCPIKEVSLGRYIYDSYVSSILADTCILNILGYYPVEIEFIGKGFKTVGKIDFDEFGVATFTDFCEEECKPEI